MIYCPCLKNKSSRRFKSAYMLYAILPLLCPATKLLKSLKLHRHYLTVNVIDSQQRLLCVANNSSNEISVHCLCRKNILKEMVFLKIIFKKFYYTWYLMWASLYLMLSLRILEQLDPANAKRYFLVQFRLFSPRQVHLGQVFFTSVANVV